MCAIHVDSVFSSDTILPFLTPNKNFGRGCGVPSFPVCLLCYVMVGAVHWMPRPRLQRVPWAVAHANILL